MNISFDSLIIVIIYLWFRQINSHLLNLVRIVLMSCIKWVDVYFLEKD